MSAIGWGGYITSGQEAAIFTRMKARRVQLYRMWANASQFVSKSWTSTSDFTQMDRIVDEAIANGMQIVLDFNHNYPPSTAGQYVRADLSSSSGQVSSQTDWIAKSKRIIMHYMQRNPAQIQIGQILFEPLNEYNRNVTGNYADGGVTQKALMTAWFSAIRSADSASGWPGYHGPVIVAFLYASYMISQNDPDNNWYADAHYYGRGFDNFVPSTPTTLTQVVDIAYNGETIRGLCNDWLGFTNANNGYMRAMAIGAKKFCMLELGPTYTTSGTYTETNPSPGTIAFAMWACRLAISHDCLVALYMMNNYSSVDASLRKFDLYEQRAQAYFGESFMGVEGGGVDQVPGTIEVYDENATYNVPLAGVQLETEGVSAVTDADGRASVLFPRLGVFALTLSKTGYVTKTLSITVQAPNHVWSIGLSQQVGVIFTCTICGASFGDQATLDAHIASAHPTVTFTCPTCGAVFATQALLDAHMASAHGQQGDYINQLFTRANAYMDEVLANPMAYIALGVLFGVFIDRTQKKD